jgi:hypothetical protein
MGESEKPKPSRTAQRRERKRLKQERTGDTPEKQAERRKPAEASPSVRDNADRAAVGGFLAGGV